MRQRFLSIISIFFIIVPLFTNAQTVPESFYDEFVMDGFDPLCGFTFDETGKMYIWEKRGVVKIVDTSQVQLQQPLIDISEEVGDWRDHGLLGFALDPNFYSNGYFYLWYVVDRHHLMYYGTPQYHPDSSWTYEATIGRLTRYTADPATGFTTTLPNSRKVLIGETIETGVPILGYYHAGGAIVFGEDNTLMLSIGDCASGGILDTGKVAGISFNTQALADGIIESDEDIGLYRAQYLGSLNGKILRLDPETGDGLASNPFYDAANPRSPQSRTWALGFRNPFRMTLMEGTGSHSPADGNPGAIVSGEVGFRKYEEINVVDAPGLNFGWPIYQGHFTHDYTWFDSPYNLLAPNPLFNSGTDCPHPYFKFQDLLLEPHATSIIAPNPCDNNQSIPNIIHRSVLTPPALSYRNRYHELPAQAVITTFDSDGKYNPVDVEDPNSWLDVENFDGECSIGGVFYKEGHFPEEYHGKYFQVDYSGWIKAIRFDENNQIQKIDDFLTNAEYIVMAAVHPKNSCLYYIGYENKLHRICYGGNPKPIAIAEADYLYGTSPLTVQFDASQSYDIFGESISFEWDFADGNTSNSVNPTYTFTTPDNDPTPVEVKLTVTDSIGQTDETTILISINNTPPTVDITSFNDGDLYPTDGTFALPLIADVEDAESAPENLTYSWTTYLHHNTHFHTEPSDDRVNTHTIISPLGCEDETFYFRVGLSVTDEHGLTTTQEKYIYPDCNGNFVEMLDLEADVFQDKVDLQWTSNFEDSVTHYVVERGTDIWNFIPIGQVTANDIQNSPNTYTFTDPTSPNRLNYYRIRAYRANNAFAYSNRITAKYSNQLVEIFPNPSQGQIGLYFSRDFANVTIHWYNAQGQKIKESFFENVQENQLEQMLLDVGSGTYLYTIQADGQTLSDRLIIQR